MKAFKKWNGNGEEILIDPSEVTTVEKYTGTFVSGTTPFTGTTVTMKSGKKHFLEDQFEEVSFALAKPVQSVFSPVRDYKGFDIHVFQFDSETGQDTDNYFAIGIERANGNLLLIKGRFRGTKEASEQAKKQIDEKK
jgi:hypothetical protein